MGKRSFSFPRFWSRFLIWRRLHVSDKKVLIFLSLIVGVCCALAAWLLKSIVELLHELVNQGFLEGDLNYLYLITPIIGIALASLFVRYIVKDDISHGVTKIMYAISQNKAVIKAHNMWSSIFASSLTIGFGGSVGAEAPIVLTGSAIGSNLGQMFKLDHKKLMLLVGCGATGAVAGIFKAPITGVLFTLEVLMLDLTMSSIVPLIVTAITATVVTFLISGTQNMFPFETTDSFNPQNTPYYVILGVVCGLVSLYFTRGNNKLESFFKSISNPWHKLVVGGSMLSFLIFFLPPLYGEGYDTITALINGDHESMLANSVFYEFKDNFLMLLVFCVMVVFFKIFATTATNGSGGTGGVFAPSLFVGCVTGFITAVCMNRFWELGLNEKYLALAGMAGVMSGVMHAPLTSTFLIAELTGGYGLFLCIMTTAVTSYITILSFEPHSIYATRLAKAGQLYTHHIDNNIQMMLKIDDLIDKDLKTITPKMYLGDVIDLIKQTQRNIFPVLGRRGKLVGILTINDIRNVMFEPQYYRTLQVQQFMLGASALIYVENVELKKKIVAEIEAERAERQAKHKTPSEKVLLDEARRIKDTEADTVEMIMKKFEFTKAWNLAVVEKGTDKYVGFLSRAKVYNAYRDMLHQVSEE